MKKKTIGKNIYNLRKNKKLTQEDLAKIVGVSAGAVSKWENDNSTPDISLLAPLARALNSSLDELLSFQQELTSEELSQIKKELTAAFMVEEYITVVEKCRSYLKEYPNSLELRLTIATSIQMYSALDSPDEDTLTKRLEYALSLLKEVAESKNSKFTSTALFAMASIFLMIGRYEECEKALKEISTSFIDPSVLYASLYERQGKFEAGMLYSKAMLLQYLNQAIAMLSILSRLSKETKNYKEAFTYLQGASSIEATFNIGLGTSSHNLSKLFLETEDIPAAGSWFKKFADTLLEADFDYSNNEFFKGLQLQVKEEGQKLMRQGMIKEILKDESFSSLSSSSDYLDSIEKLKAYVEDN